MPIHRVEQTIAEYVVEVKRQNTEEARKLRFQSLVTSLFSDSPDAVRVIHEMARSAEKLIRIPLPDRIKQGRADTVFNEIANRNWRNYSHNLPFSDHSPSLSLVCLNWNAWSDHCATRSSNCKQSTSVFSRTPVCILSS